MRGCVELWLPYDRFRWIMVAFYIVLSYLRTSILSVFYECYPTLSEQIQNYPPKNQNFVKEVNDCNYFFYKKIKISWKNAQIVIIILFSKSYCYINIIPYIIIIIMVYIKYLSKVHLKRNHLLKQAYNGSTNEIGTIWIISAFKLAYFLKKS